MDNSQWLPMLGSFAVGASLAAALASVWAAKRRKREHEHLAHIEQARQQGALQLTQARKQIEQLQRENHELRLAVRPTPRPAPAPEPPVDAAEAARRYLEARLLPTAAEEADRPFKDTLLLPRSES